MPPLSRTGPEPALGRYIRRAPKVELHVHLEGAIRPGTLLQLARRNRVELPAREPAALEEWFRYRGFSHFAAVYLTVCRTLRHAEDFALAVRELGAELGRQGVCYAEVTTTPSMPWLNGVAPDAYLAGLAEGRARVRQDHGLELAWIFDIVRSIEDAARRTRLADLTTALAIEGREVGVVALGLGAREDGYPAGQFRPFFERARAAGLHAAPHAGELAGPESVREAIEELGAERIGHGVRSIEDPALVERLAREGIALEICPTSNLRLGVVRSLAGHPLPRLLEAGVVVTVSSDDPALFGTTLTEELLLLADPFGLDRAAVDRVLLDAVRASFLEPSARRRLEQKLRSDLARLRGELGMAEPQP